MTTQDGIKIVSFDEIMSDLWEQIDKNNANFEKRSVVIAEIIKAARALVAADAVTGENLAALRDAVAALDAGESGKANEL